MNPITITHKHAHIHTKHHSKIYSSRTMVKESSLSKPISLAKMYHSSPLFLIHLLIPLFLCHFIQMFPELVSVHGRLMSCWGLWQSATSFYPFTSCFGVCIMLCPFSVYGMHVSVFALFMCLCVESWSRCLFENAVTTAPNPPCIGIYSPNPHICSCVFAIAASCSQPPHFSLFYSWGGTQNKGEKVAQFPPLGSHTPTGTHPRSNTLSAHAQCLTALSDLHVSPRSSLMHRHAVELFKSLRWGAPKLCCYCVGGLLVSGC